MPSRSARLEGPHTAALLGQCCAALASTPPRLLRPRAPDQRLLGRIEDAGLPPGRATVGLSALVQASRRAPTALVAEGVRRPWIVALGLTSFLVEHRQARFLVDAALCADAHARAVSALPLPLRLLLAPRRPVEGMVEALRRAGLAPGDLDFVLPTHLHWDHVAGLLDLPDDLLVRTSTTEHASAMGPDRAPAAVIRSPLAARPTQLYELDGPPVLTFTSSLDLFGDGAVVLVDLAGHTPGSIGVLLALHDGSRVLLAGDAVWHRLQARLLRQRAPFPSRIVDHDPRAAYAVVHRLHALPESVALVPAHDLAAALPWAPAEPA